MKNKKKATSKIRVEKIGGSTSAGNSKYFRLVSEWQIEGKWECRRGDSNPKRFMTPLNSSIWDVCC